MKRKIMKLADTTYAVSLPLKLVRKYNLQKGQEVDIAEEKNNCLSINFGKSEQELQKIDVDIRNLNERAVRIILGGLHKKGYDILNITYSKEEQLGIIEDLVKNLMLGFIISEETKNRCVVMALGSQNSGEFDLSLKRAFYVTFNMFEQLIEYLKEPKSHSLDKILLLEKTNNQLCDFCQRTINKSSTDENSTFKYLLPWNLEKVCDDLKYIIVYIKERKVLLSGKSIDVLEETLLFLRASFDMLYSFDFTKLDKVTKDKKLLQNKLLDMMMNAEKSEIPVFVHLYNMQQKAIDSAMSYYAMQLKNKQPA